jgi:hypothetical protein
MPPTTHARYSRTKPPSCEIPSAFLASRGSWQEGAGSGYLSLRLTARNRWLRAHDRVVAPPFSPALPSRLTPGDRCLRFWCSLPHAYPRWRLGEEGIGVVGWWERSAASVAASRDALPAERRSPSLTSPPDCTGRWEAFGASAFIEGRREGGRVAVSSPSPRLPANPALLVSRGVPTHADGPTDYIFAPNLLTNFVSLFFGFLCLFGYFKSFVAVR